MARHILGHWECLGLGRQWGHYSWRGLGPVSRCAAIRRVPVHSGTTEKVKQSRQPMPGPAIAEAAIVSAAERERVLGARRIGGTGAAPPGIAEVASCQPRGRQHYECHIHDSCSFKILGDSARRPSPFWSGPYTWFDKGAFVRSPPQACSEKRPAPLSERRQVPAFERVSVSFGWGLIQS